MDKNSNRPMSFEEMQKSMANQFDLKRKDWEKNIEEIRDNFFKLGKATSSDEERQQIQLDTSTIPKPFPERKFEGFDFNNDETIIEDGSKDKKIFRMRFDVRDFKPEDISVRTEGDKLLVTAKHTDLSGEKMKASKQFNRAVDIPEEVHPENLMSYLSADGILTVEAPVAAMKRRNVKVVYNSDMPIQRNLDTFETTNHSSTGPFKPIHSSTSDGRRLASSSTSKFKSLEELSEGSIQRNQQNIIHVDGGKKLIMIIDIGGDFKARDINIHLHDSKVSIQASSKLTLNGKTSRREYSKEFDIAEPLERSTFQALLSSDHLLYIAGSCSSSASHRKVMQSIHHDMPIDGERCKLLQ